MIKKRREHIDIHTINIIMLNRLFLHTTEKRDCNMWKEASKQKGRKPEHHECLCLRPFLL